MLRTMKSFLADERGQASTEYAVIIGVIALALIGVLALFREELKNVFDRAQGQLQTIETAPPATP
jgi:pilus assembly protein Flp/PilA